MSSKPLTTQISEVPPALRGDKAALREWAKARRATLDMPALSAVLTSRLQSLPELSAARNILIYLAASEEINVEGVIERFGDGRRFFAPRCAPKRGLNLCEYTPERTPLKSGPFGIREPETDGAEVEPETIDAVIVPALLLTPDGARLGYGGGYYDRFLPRLRPDCVMVGVMPAALVVSELPQDDWDIRLKIVVTERDVFRALNLPRTP